MLCSGHSSIVKGHCLSNYNYKILQFLHCNILSKELFPVNEDRNADDFADMFWITEVFIEQGISKYLSLRISFDKNNNEFCLVYSNICGPNSIQ